MATRRAPADAAKGALARALLASLALCCAHGPSVKDRQSATIHHDLAYEALRAGRFPEALREYDEALALDDTFAAAHLGRGLVLEYGFGKLREAADEYRRALELRSGYSEAHNNLGQLLARTGRLEEAIREFDAALANMLYKEPWVARCNKGIALHQLGRREDGLAELRACVAQAPRYCHGQKELGRLLLADGRLEEALAGLERHAKDCDSSPDYWLQMAQARLRSGRADGAREAFRKCESLAGDSAVAAECRRSLEMLH